MRGRAAGRSTPSTASCGTSSLRRCNARPCQSGMRWSAATTRRSSWSVSSAGRLSQVKPYMYAEEVNGFPEMRMMYTSQKLTADRAIAYDKGIAIFDAWDAFVADVMQNEPVCRDNAPHATFFQESFAGAYHFAVETLVKEAFLGIALALTFAFIILTVFTHNLIVGFLAAATIAGIVGCVMGFMVMAGWKLGMLESIILVMVPGMSVDYVAHLAESYVGAHCKDRHGRVRTMLEEVGVSVLSGAFSTMGATIFLLFPTITFFVKLGIAIFMTIAFSLFFSLCFFSSMMAFFGPSGDTGDFLVLCRKGARKVSPAENSAPVVVSSPNSDEETPNP
eukprot:TRINITY_DN7692_c0_g1_i2.p1 TRINITY_DN7692_c0_g1~~TRINITY_DN7692_c0_g1_i2.p1  ORF type:complete len:335 (+),score=89.28 TRINITY_DN7692_c0_g1_i2:185-1189(+)